jgi:hypothetical protein
MFADKYQRTALKRNLHHFLIRENPLNPRSSASYSPSPSGGSNSKAAAVKAVTPVVIVGSISG